mgnify:CR=1 FL=1
MNRESIKRDIAIIGTSCKFSKSENPAQFWENLKLGNELIEFYTDDELIKDILTWIRMISQYQQI